MNDPLEIVGVKMLGQITVLKNVEKLTGKHAEVMI